MSKKNLFLTFLVAVLFFTAALLAKMPASFVVSQALKQNRQLTISQVSGTIWDGQAAYVAVRQFNRTIVLGKVDWQVSAMSLLMGRFEVNLKAKHGDQRIQGDFTVKLDKTLIAKNAEIRVDAQLLSQIYPSMVKPEGFVELDITDLAFKDMEVLALDANLLVRDLFVTVQTRVDLGTYGARLGLEGDAIKADLSDIDGHVGIEGYGLFSPKTREYQVDFKLSPKATAHPSIAQALTFVGKKQGDGSFTVNMKQKL